MPCEPPAVAPQVIDTKLQKVEGVQEDRLVVVPVPDEVEVRTPIRPTGDRLAVDHTGLAPQPRRRLHDEWEPLGQVVAWTAVEPHLCAVLAGDDPEPVVLDFMQPELARRAERRIWWEARRDETQHPGFLNSRRLESNRKSGGEALVTPNKLGPAHHELR